MSKKDEYREKLKGLDTWIPFLIKNSGLPGPRCNLELAQVVAEEGKKPQFEKYVSLEAKENTPEVFLVFCGVVRFGKLAASGEHEIFSRLRNFASDPRWRIREAVAIALQHAGDKDMNFLIKELQGWSKGNWYEKRAAAAALAEPRLLKEAGIAREVLNILDQITKFVESAGHPKDEGFKVLCKSLGYCWSVAVAALPPSGKPLMEKWLVSKNPDVRGIMKENLKKNRLLKMDAGWVKDSLGKL
jgi:hypothetical protein